jgi:hypothetical protein
MAADALVGIARDRWGVASIGKCAHDWATEFTMFVDGHNPDSGEHWGDILFVQRCRKCGMRRSLEVPADAD